MGPAQESPGPAQEQALPERPEAPHGRHGDDPSYRRWNRGFRSNYRHLSRGYPSFRH